MAVHPRSSLCLAILALFAFTACLPGQPAPGAQAAAGATASPRTSPMAATGTTPAALTTSTPATTPTTATTPATTTRIPDPTAASTATPRPASTTTAVVASSPTPLPAQTATPAPPAAVSAQRPAQHPFVFGVTIADASDAPGRSFALAREAGLTHAYVVVDWANVLRDGGRFAWDLGQPSDLDNFLRAARAQDVRLVVRLARPHGWSESLSRLDPALMERFAEGVAARAKGVATAYEVLNEPNLPFEWGGPPDPAGYARLLAAARRGIKRADPDAIVLAAGLSPYTGGQGGSMEDVPYLRALYAAGVRGSFDVMAMHAYGGPRPPDQDPGACGMCFRRVEHYRQVMVEQGDADTPAWITEFGYVHATGLNLGPYDWMKVAPQQQADYLTAAYDLARRRWPWLTGMVLFNLDFSTVPWNPPTSGAHWFALLNPDRTPRPAYLAVKNLPK